MNPKAQQICDQLIKEHKSIGYSSINIAGLAIRAGLNPLRRREAEKLFAYQPLHYKGYTFTYSSPIADLKARLGLLKTKDDCSDCLDTGWKWDDSMGQFTHCYCPGERS